MDGGFRADVWRRLGLWFGHNGGLKALAHCDVGRGSHRGSQKPPTPMHTHTRGSTRAHTHTHIGQEALKRKHAEVDASLSHHESTLIGHFQVLVLEHYLGNSFVDQ